MIKRRAIKHLSTTFEYFAETNTGDEDICKNVGGDIFNKELVTSSYPFKVITNILQNILGLKSSKDNNLFLKEYSCSDSKYHILCTYNT